MFLQADAAARRGNFANILNNRHIFERSRPPAQRSFAAGEPESAQRRRL